MNKKFILPLLLTFVLIVSLSFSSAYGLNSYNNGENTYSKTITTREKATSYDYNNRYGYQRTTIDRTDRVTIERKDFTPRYYFDSCDRDYYRYDCNGYPRSSYRYAPVYDSRDYSYNRAGDYCYRSGSRMICPEQYTDDYYYKPRYDWHLGFYNNRY